MATGSLAAERGRSLWPLVAILWVGAVAILLQSSSDVAVGLAVMHVVAFAGAVVVWFAAKRTESPAIVRIIVWGWALKMVGTLARFFVLEVVYKGAGDANRYAYVGGILSQRMRTGDFSRYVATKQLIGTQFVEMFTGGMYVFTGKTVLGGFFLYSAIGFAGLYLIFRAVRIAAPEVDQRRYALLLFFLPSTLFWPSSIGKESLMMFCIGVVVYGLARMFEHMPGGIPIVLAGLGASAMIRPHITLMLAVAVMGASTITRSRTAPGDLPLAKWLRVIVFIVAVAVAMSVASSFLKVDNLDAENVNATLQATNARTSQGGSSFGGGSPAAYPLSVVTVMFRPFPFEAGNLQSAIASVETTLLLVLFVRRRAGVREAFRRLRSNGLLAFVLVYSALFFYVYSSFGNFGLLARQRVQLYPLVIMFICISPADGSEAGPLRWWRSRQHRPVSPARRRPAVDATAGIRA